MNLFVEYTKEEIEYLLSLLDKNSKLNNPLFNGISKNEIYSICRYLSFEDLPEKKVIEDYDLIWIVDGCLVEVEGKKILRKFYKNTILGVESRFFKEKKRSLITIKKSKLIFFDIKNIHNEITSKFYKNLFLLYASKFSEKG